ncbi:GNAT family N-acetyltransferase [Agrococcus sp. Marseille-Q4369]|uniref:GNAT family N-acetyltransferase n=1 Tax=Agrococcus sp. Marseille-Q4369 TaxID=2810513 RepID=UPI001B8C4C3A|nr:GNAT family N-acetyltransferase [Agrococcus sp. Marseille-Q4369]QUW18514.1 GNAT family N-acetyltransferase [Agrococcus sp. Marseille-Q4369]
MSAAPLAGPSLPVLGRTVLLTALREDDVDRVVEACSTEQARRFLDTPWPYSRADAEGFVREFAPAGWRGEHDERVWAIRESIRGPLAGVIGLRTERGEVGFWLHPDAQGKGHMADALRTVVGHAEGCLTWPEVHWRCHDGNLGSMRVAKAAGFAYLGTVPGTQRGEPVLQHHAVRVASGMPATARPWPPLD